MDSVWEGGCAARSQGTIVEVLTDDAVGRINQNADFLGIRVLRCDRRGVIDHPVSAGACARQIQLVGSFSFSFSFALAFTLALADLIVVLVEPIENVGNIVGAPVAN